MVSGASIGTAVGAMYGYGASASGVGYGRANDSAGLGGLIGLNVGAIGTAAMSLAYEPSWDGIAWMWTGAGIGALISLPVFLFYTGEDSPPAKRGFLFMATATMLGSAAGVLFGTEDVGLFAGDDNWELPHVARITHLAPVPVPSGLGLAVGGELF
jgi:hypothetical protein